MNFTAEEQKRFEEQYDYIRSKIDELRDNPTLISAFPIEEYPHIWKRFEELKAKSREELMQEIEADYVLLSFQAEQHFKRD